MKRMWGGRLRPAASTGLSLSTLSGQALNSGAMAPAFAVVVDQVMNSVPPATVSSEAIRAAVEAIVANEAKALAEGETEPAGDSVIDARMRARAREQFVRGGAEGVRQWGSELAALIADVLRSVRAPKQTGHTIEVEVPLIGQLDNPAAVIDAIVVRVLGWSSEGGRFRPGGLVARRVKVNLLNASNMTEDDAKKRPQKLIWPKSAKGSAMELVDRYLAHTPFADLLMSGVPWGIGERELCESVHVMARTGHGKSQLLQFMIAQLLAETNPPGLIVIDSQGEMLQKIGRLKVFAPGQRLANRLVYVDPRETERPVSVNPFAKNRDRMARYSGVMREQVENHVLDLLTYLFDGILGSGLTGKQGLSFTFVVRLMMHVPGATIATVLDFLKEPALFSREMAALGGRDREFFERQFFDKSNKATIGQIERRLWEVLSHRTFERMLGATDNKLDLYDALNSGKVVLIDTAKDFLGETRSAILARMWVAMTLRAVFERAAIPEAQRRPAFLIIDEAHDVVDASVEKWIEQARKYKCGLCVAHQQLAQISADLRKGLSGVGVKIIGAVSAHDAEALAPDLGVSPAFLLGLQRHEKAAMFALHVKNVTRSAVPLSVPLGYLENQPRMSEAEWNAVREQSRQRYGASCRSTAHVASKMTGAARGGDGDDDSGDNWRS